MNGMLTAVRKGILRRGVQTIRDPHLDQEGGKGFPLILRDSCTGCGECGRACPAGAISLDDEMTIDLGRCQVCHACVDACPVKAMVDSGRSVVAVAGREELLEDVDKLEELRRSRIRGRGGRSLSIREVDAGSCNGCEVEVNALSNAIHDMERMGMRIVASPRHADMLLVTGPVTEHMLQPLRGTYEAMPEPRLVVAMGSCAISGGMWHDTLKGVAEVIPVDVFVPGCPPRPQAIVQGILLALERQVNAQR